MPRVENAGNNVDEWYATAGGNGSSTFDVCSSCFKEHDGTACKDIPEIQEPYNGDPPGDGPWVSDVAHPDYDDGDTYECVICRRVLTDAEDA